MLSVLGEEYLKRQSLNAERNAKWYCDSPVARLQYVWVAYDMGDEGYPISGDSLLGVKNAR